MDMIKFEDLYDGSKFQIAMVAMYGCARTYVKALEDGGEHNAVDIKDSSACALIPNDCWCIPV